MMEKPESGGERTVWRSCHHGLEELPATTPVPSIDFSSSVSMGLGGLGLASRGGSALSLDMEREGPAVDPRDPGWGESAASSAPSSTLVDS